jgi:hypothetical protein
VSPQRVDSVAVVKTLISAKKATTLSRSSCTFSHPLRQAQGGCTALHCVLPTPRFPPAGLSADLRLRRGLYRSGERGQWGCGGSPTLGMCRFGSLLADGCKVVIVHKRGKSSYCLGLSVAHSAEPGLTYCSQRWRGFTLPTFPPAHPHHGLLIGVSFPTSWSPSAVSTPKVGWIGAGAQMCTFMAGNVRHQQSKPGTSPHRVCDISCVSMAYHCSPDSTSSAHGVVGCWRRKKQFEAFFPTHPHPVVAHIAHNFKFLYRSQCCPAAMSAMMTATVGARCVSHASRFRSVTDEPGLTVSSGVSFRIHFRCAQPLVFSAATVWSPTSSRCAHVHRARCTIPATDGLMLAGNVLFLYCLSHATTRLRSPSTASPYFGTHGTRSHLGGMCGCTIGVPASGLQCVQRCWVPMFPPTFPTYSARWPPSGQALWV